MYAYQVTGSEFTTVLPTGTVYPVEQLNGGVIGGVTGGITGGITGGVTGGIRSTGQQQQQPIQTGVEGLWEQPEIVRGLAHLPRVLPFYAKTRQGLEQIMEHVEQNPSDLATHCLLNAQSTTYTPKVYPYRGFTLVNGEQKMRQIEQVEQLEERPVWFLFSGMGIEQWQCGMTREMMKLDSFRRSILRSCQVLRPYGINLMKLVIGGAQGEQEGNNVVMTGIESFVYLTSVQIALVDCLRQIGVRPEGLIGQSIGELVCAYVEQCLTHEQTLMTSYYLAKCIQQAQQLPKSMMAIVGDLTWEQLRNKCPQGVVPVCFDSLDQFLITGPHQQVRDLLRQLRLEGVYVREIELPTTPSTVGCVENFSYIHTQYMNEFVPVLRQYLECLNIVPKQRSSRWISTSVPEQKWSTPMGQLFNIEYLLNLLTSPVMLHQTLRQVPRNAILIEISPRSLVQTLLKKSLFQQYQQQQLINGTPSVVVVVPTVIPLMPTTFGVELPSFLEHFLVQMGRLYLEGIEFDSVKLFVPVHLERTVYPVPVEQQLIGLFTKWDIKPEPLSYYYVVKSFEQQGSFEQTCLSGLKSLNLNDCGVVGGAEGVETIRFTVDVESLLEKESYLLNHQINGRVLYPTTGYLYLVWKSMAQLQRNVRQTGPICLDSVFGQSCEFEQLPVVHFENVQIHRATVLREQPKQVVIVPENRRVSFEIRIQPTTGLFEIVEGKNLIVNGRVTVVPTNTTTTTTGTFELNEFVTPFKAQWESQVRCNLVLSQEEIYKQFRQCGYEFNGEFQPIVRSNVQGTQGELLWTGKWIPFLDAMLQMNVLAQQQQQQQVVGQQCLLPTRIRSVKINPVEHIIRAEKYVTLPVVHDVYTNKTQCGSIEIVGLQVTPVVLPNGQFNPTINNVENCTGVYSLTQVPTPVRSFGQWTVEQQQQEQPIVGGLFNPRMTHVIVGGLDCEFGFELAQWMVQFGGVRYLVLTTVRPVVEQFLTVEQIQKLRYLQNEFDCQIKVVSTLDLSEESECLLLIKQACRMTSHFEGKIGSLFHLGGLFVESKPVATTPALLRSFYHFDKLTRSSSVMPEYGLFVAMTRSIVTPGQSGLQTVVESVCESRRRECGRHGLVVEWTGLFNVEFDFYPKLNAIQYKQAMTKLEQLIVKSVKIQFPIELQQTLQQLQQSWGIVESMTGYPSIESTSSISVEQQQQQPKQSGAEQLQQFEEIAQGKRLNRLIELLSVDFDFEQPEFVQGSSSVMIRSRRQVQEGEKQVYLMPTRIVEKLNDVEFVFGQQQQPLFVVLPIEGSIQMIKSWAQQLRVPVYGLQYTQECLRFETVEQLAQFYWQQIEIAFPSLDKFHLVGHTFGVPVAFEMALRRPQQVISLALLDSGLTQTFLNVRESTTTTTTGLTGVAVTETEALYRFYQQFVAPSVRMPVEQFYQILSTQMTTFDERVKYVVGKIVEQSPFSFNLVDLEQTARSFVKKLIISAKYVPTQPLRLNKILVVRPTIKCQPSEYFYGQTQQQEQLFEQEQIERVFRGLRQFVFGKVQVYLVDGEQKTFLHGETGCRIASILNQHLAQF